MKTDATRLIESALVGYNPKELSGVKLNQFRDRFYAFEVPVMHGTTKEGLIDFVRVDEYFGDIEQVRRCRCVGRKSFWERYGGTSLCGKEFHELPQSGVCDKTFCRMNYPSDEGVAKILITAVEIKVTKADFGSKHGHNFVGNLNYYAVPKELYPKVSDMVPDNIGVILYHEGRLRKAKDSAFCEMSDAEQKWMLMSVTKRMQSRYFAEICKLKSKHREEGFL